MSRKKKSNRRFADSFPSNESVKSSKSWYNQFFEDVTSRINEGIFSVIADAENEKPNNSVRVLIGLLILKEVFDYSDYELFEKVKHDFSFQKALGQKGLVSSTAYTSFCHRLYRYERQHGRNLISECFIAISGNRSINVQRVNTEVKVNSASIFTHIAHQVMYGLMSKALDKCVQNRKNDLGVNLRKRVEDILRESEDLTFKSKADELKVRLQNLGKLSHEVLRRYNIRTGTSNQLRNYYDKYFEEANGQIIIKEIKTDKDVVCQGVSSITGGIKSKIIESVRKVTEQMQVSLNSPEFNKLVAGTHKKDNDEIHETNKEASRLKIEHKENMSQQANEEVNKRLDNIEKTLAKLSETMDRHFVAMQPIEKMLLRLETLYNNLACLDGKILSQEASLNSMVQKHVKISEYTQDLSKTSKEIYDLMKLLLMNSIIEQTKDIKK